MKLTDFMKLAQQGQRRCHLVGDAACGTLIALDVEGRLFTVLHGEVLNRVNPAAFTGFSSSAAYLNPGGDGLWPAPEGSRLGYEYATPGWRVPPGLCHARWTVTAATAQSATASAEIDLINAEGRGVPCRFTREVTVSGTSCAQIQQVRERIEYLGRRPLDASQALIAPWSLCQFDCDESCELLVAPCPAADIRDLYQPASDSLRRQSAEGWHYALKTDFRFQLGLAPAVSWIEFRNPRSGFRVRRSAAPLASGLACIDIADRDPGTEPDGAPVKLSAYCDPSGFMEIEAAGGALPQLTPGCSTDLHVTTLFTLC